MKRAIEFLLFSIIFCVYFSSSVGLMNSGDSPQYFTTEAILKNRDINMASFWKDPHFFIWPDFFIYNNQILNMRGYMVSLFALPLHGVAYLVKDFITLDVLSNMASVTENMPYEVAITSLFTLFSIVGIICIHAVNERITGSRTIALLTTVSLAFGTYIWKYSAFYARHGIVVFLLGLAAYSISQPWYKKGGEKWRLLFCTVWAMSFGVDLLLFVVLSIYVALDIGYALWKKRFHFSLFLPSVFWAGFLIGINIIINLTHYGTFLSSSYEQNVIMKDSLKGIPATFWFSTPLFPTIFSTLFGFGKIPNSAFVNYDNIPSKIQTFVSLSYMKQYSFYGILSISPFLLFSFASLRNINKSKWKHLIFFCFVTFFAGIVLTTKYFGFWGGNQYDIRYFFPYVICLAPVMALGLKQLSIVFRRNVFPLVIVVIGSIIWSIWMGWIGMINMFRPALMGERKIWIEALTFPLRATRYTPLQYINATFPNRENVWLAIMICLFSYSIYLVFMAFFLEHKMKRQTRKRKVEK